MPDKFYTTKKDEKALQKAALRCRWLDRKLLFTCHSNAVLIPAVSWNEMGAVFDSSRKIVSGSSWTYSERESKFFPENVGHKESKVIYIGCLVNIWGHTFTDNLARVWFLFTPKFEQLIKEGWSVVYSTLENQLSDNALSILRLAGVDVYNIGRVSKPTEFDQIIVPDACFGEVEGDDWICTREYSDLIEKIKKNATKNTVEVFPKKIYLTRRGWMPHKDQGEEKRIEDIFERKGFYVVKPQELSVENQITMLSNADFIISTDGSLSHNFIFCRKDAEQVILRKSNYIHIYQARLNFILGSDVTWIKTNHSVCCSRKEPYNGPFYVCPTVWLYAFTMDARGIFIPFIHSSFWKYILKSSRTINLCLVLAQKVRKTLFH